MKTLQYWSVWIYWYNMDASSPSDAHEHEVVADFSTEEAASAYCAELAYVHSENLRNETLHGCSEWFEKREYNVSHSTLNICDTVEEFEGLDDVREYRR